MARSGARREFAARAGLSWSGVGGLATAGTAMAAPAPAREQTVGAEAVTPLAVVNLGLDTAQAKSWQCRLSRTGYNPGAIDGQLGTSSWKAAQEKFNDLGYKAGIVDAIVGTDTIKALQRFLNLHGAGLAVDGVAGSAAKAAFWNFSGAHRC
ncbi:peptidoglycan-binding domain-containing protein [Streptomyces sp. NPDC002911]